MAIRQAHRYRFAYKLSAYLLILTKNEAENEFSGSFFGFKESSSNNL
jgi:hypothetical protein